MALPFAWIAPLLALLPAPACAAKLELKEGDRIVLLGGGLLEQERHYGYLATRLARRFPAAATSFRNLAWSGDTVRGEARTGGLGNPEGLARLLKEVQAHRPTVILLAYGTNESFAGPAALPAFVHDYARLLDQLGPLGARLVVLSPGFHEDLGPPLPDPAGHNRDLEQYTAALATLAKRRQLRFVDLYHPMRKANADAPTRRLTTNGLLPSGTGYWLIGAEVERQLLGEAGPWTVALDRSGKIESQRGARLGPVRAGPAGLAFDVTPAILPPPPGLAPPAPPVLRIAGLPAGVYALQVNGKEILRAKVPSWEQGVPVARDPGAAQVEKLRAALVAQAELFYRRWRPFNDFAEHWGYIKGDFERYDGLIASYEARIARLRRPAPLRVQIRPVAGP